MSLRVLKFGGSSLSDLPAIERIAERVAQAHRQGDRLVVVCSAMGGTTDDLLRLAESTAPGTHGRELDMLVTAGERVSAALLSLRLGHIGTPAWSLTGSQSGIVTDGAHGRARILAIRPHRVLAGLEAKRVVVVAGFQGVSEHGEVTSLARGGSDTTAVALAAALSADSCEIYSDVDGVYTADPRQVPDATHLAEIDVDTMQALADGGAKVLAAEAIALAKRAGIAIEAGHAHRPGRSTRIAGGWQPSLAPLAAITSRAALRTQPGVELPDAPLLWASPHGSVFGWPAEAPMAVGGTSADASFSRRVALVTLVGRPTLAQWLGPVWTALASLPNARWLGATHGQASFVVEPGDEAEALRRAHACLVRAQRPEGRPSVPL